MGRDRSSNRIFKFETDWVGAFLTGKGFTGNRRLGGNPNTGKGDLPFNHLKTTQGGGFMQQLKLYLKTVGEEPVTSEGHEFPITTRGVHNEQQGGSQVYENPGKISGRDGLATPFNGA
ncbi:MAG: hypothetical protein ABEK59_12260 [Halobacteria archaeon]